VAAGLAVLAEHALRLAVNVAVGIAGVTAFLAGHAPQTGDVDRAALHD
jgi:hypothetical protein